MAATRTSRASIYALLQVHPAAPLELITAVYWRLVGRAGVSNRGEASSRVKQLERAYEVLSDPEKRAAYDSAMNIAPNPPLPGLQVDGSTTKRLDGDATGSIDYYEILRVDPAAERSVIEAAYPVMRELYEAVIQAGDGAPSLIERLDQAFAALRNPASRRRYDAERAEAQAPGAAAPRDGVIQSIVAEARQPTRVDRDSLLFRVSIVASAISVLCLVVGMATSSLDLTDYGIAKSFPVSFYVGLVLLPLASSCLWFTNRKVDAIVLGQLLLLMVAIWLSPYLLESTARFRSSYKNFSAVDWLADGDGFAPDLVVYHNWPGFPVVMTGVLKITGLSPTQLMGLFPFVIQIAYLFPLTYLLRVFRPAGNGWWAGVWFFYLFNWTGQDYFAPQALAFFLFLCLLALFAHMVAHRDGYFGLPLMALTLAIYGSLVVTHVLTAGIVLAIVLTLTASGQMRQRSLLLATTVMFFAWQIYGAADFFNFSNQRIADNILDIQDFFNLNIGSRLAGTPDHVVVGRLRMLMTLIAAGVAAICFLMRLTERHDRRSLELMGRGADSTLQTLGAMRQRSLMYLWQPAPFAVFCFLALAIVAPLYVYGGEMLIRALLFSLPAFSLLVAGAFKWRTPVIAVVALMALVAPLHMVARYGNEMYDYVSPKEVEGFNYVSSHGPANIYGGYPAGTFENTIQLDWRYGIQPGKNKPPDADGYLRPDRNRWRHDDWPIYVAVSRGDAAAARLFYNQPQFIDKVKSEIERRCNFQVVFDNGDFTLYRWHPTCSPAASVEGAR
jgi:DnaJ domain